MVASPDGITFVGLAPLTDPDLLPSVLLHALGLQESGGRPARESLEVVLAAQQRLLVLDNFEQILPAAPMVTDLLGACPRFTTIVTSRAPLHVLGEYVLPIEPLAPADAVALFRERLQLVERQELSEEDEAAVEAICRRLDGLPLAIKLAAARCRELAPAALLRRLDDRLAVLTGGQRDLPARQQTLRAALDWSHGLLTPDAQRLFRRLAIFQGGFSLESAEALDQVVGNGDVLEPLRDLVDHSLVRRWGQRYAMLETVREYALERLAASGEDETCRRAHAMHFLAVAEEADGRITIEGPRALMQLDAEQDNLRAALSWSRVHDPELMVQLAGAAGLFWSLAGHFQEGSHWLECALGVSDGSGPAGARVRGRLAAILEESGCIDRERALANESLDAYRALGDRLGEALELGLLGSMDEALGRYRMGAARLEASLEIYREFGHTAGC